MMAGFSFGAKALIESPNDRIATQRCHRLYECAITTDGLTARQQSSLDR
jgi:hypothetical protein